jgi:predicted metal-dependent HD superfamily phosphohydrolase
VVIQEFLFDQWMKATPWRQPPKVKPHTTVSDPWFNRLWDLHSDKSRHYHTIVHLWEMLSWVEAMEQDDPIVRAPAQLSSNSSMASSWFFALRLATFFHDAIYDPASQRNEQDSAELWDEFCSSQRNMEEGWFQHHDDSAPNIAKIVRTLILATESHQVIREYSGTGGVSDNKPLVDVDLQATFLDIDMAVLGKSRQAYFAYASLIRQEYQHVPRQVYCKKRAEVLDEFCRSRTIYISPLFQEFFESHAKDNMMAEIELLKKGTIPGQLA